MECNDPFKLENKIKYAFNNKFKLIAGNEYYKGNENEVFNVFLNVVLKHKNNDMGVVDNAIVNADNADNAIVNADNADNDVVNAVVNTDNDIGVVNADNAVVNADNDVVNAVVNTDNDIGVVNADNDVVNADNAVVNADNAVVNADNAVVNADNKNECDKDKIIFKYSCKLCNYNVTNNNNFKKHCNTNTHINKEKINNYCLLCNKKYSTYDSFRIHKYNIHNKKISNKINKTKTTNNIDDKNIYYSKIQKNVYKCL